MTVTKLAEYGGQRIGGRSFIRPSSAKQPRSGGKRAPGFEGATVGRPRRRRCRISRSSGQRDACETMPARAGRQAREV